MLSEGKLSSIFDPAANTIHAQVDGLNKTDSLEEIQPGLAGTKNSVDC